MEREGAVCECVCVSIKQVPLLRESKKDLERKCEMESCHLRAALPQDR